MKTIITTITILIFSLISIKILYFERLNFNYLYHNKLDIISILITICTLILIGILVFILTKFKKYNNLAIILMSIILYTSLLELFIAVIK